MNKRRAKKEARKRDRWNYFETIGYKDTKVMERLFHEYVIYCRHHRKDKDEDFIFDF